jgi:hypothetical protein
MPERVQMSRQHPWRAEHPDAVIVARPSKWGNPFQVGEMVTINTMRDLSVIEMTRQMAVACYRDVMRTRLQRDPADMPEDAAWVQQWHDDLAALRGRDLACWCPLDQPCHADVLLELANG